MKTFLARLPALALAALAACASGAPDESPPAVARPNFLFLFADDQRADTLGAWGNPHIRTPNLDALIARGFSFRSNYCMGGNAGAVCVPSRAMLNSGRAFFRIPNDLKGEKLLPELLGEHGYVTFGTGKWHNGPESFLRGFQRGKSVFLGGMADHFKVPLQDVSPARTFENKRTGGKHSSELFADAAVEFLSGYREEAPFYAYVAFTAPHDPRDPPAEHREAYYRNRPPLPRNFRPLHPFDNGSVRGRDENLGPWPRTGEIVRDQLCEYYGLITHLDEQIGRVLRALEASGRAKDTVVVYAADHGLALGSHGLLGKQSVYEHSMKCPLVVAGPGVPRGRETRAYTYLLDLFPTFCSLAGVPAPADLDGKRLDPLWRGEAASVRDSLFLAYIRFARSVQDGRWKLIRYPQIDRTQLFDLASDPDEMADLSADPAQRPRIERLTGLLREWQRRLGDEQPLSVPNPKPGDVDLSAEKRPPDAWQPEWIRRKYFGLEK
jgi:arylsulfatase A-like enzyme